MNKIVLAAIATLAGCTDQPESQEPAAMSTLAKCGPVSWMPRLSYTTATDPSRVAVDTKTWNAHVTWVVDVTRWADCIYADVGARMAEACGQAPRIPAWSYLPDPSDERRVLVDSKVWDAHMAWTGAMSTWSECGEQMIEALQ